MTFIQADAHPEKSLFLEMFVRDLSLEDCILDLVDNSIDSLIRSRNINIFDVMVPSVARDPGEPKTAATPEPATIHVTYDAKRFQISDNCGGITLEQAKSEVFRIGHAQDAPVGQLGVYGIGLKRAIFKIGNHIVVESRTSSEGFRMDLDVPSWKKEPSNWFLPLQVIAGTGNSGTAGTNITVESYSVEVAQRFNSGTFEGHLKQMIARTYCLLSLLQNSAKLAGNWREVRCQSVLLWRYLVNQSNIHKNRLATRTVAGSGAYLSFVAPFGAIEE